MSISAVGSSNGAVPSMAAGQFLNGQAAGAPASGYSPDSLSNPQQTQPSSRFADGVYGVRPDHKHKKKHHGLAIALGLATLTLLGAIALIASHGRLWGKPTETTPSKPQTKGAAGESQREKTKALTDGAKAVEKSLHELAEHEHDLHVEAEHTEAEHEEEEHEDDDDG